MKQSMRSIPSMLMVLAVIVPACGFAQERPEPAVISSSLSESVDNHEQDVSSDEERQDLNGQVPDVAEAKNGDADSEGCCEQPFYAADAYVGYRIFSSRDSLSRSAHYEDVRSGVTGGVAFTGLGKDLKLMVDGLFLSDNDYNAEVIADFQGVYRTHLRTEGFYHNLDHVPVAFSPFTFLAPYGYRDDNPNDRYGLAVNTNQASFRYKMPSYPFHLNLGFWQLKREGLRQQIYSDHIFNTVFDNKIYSKSRRIDNEINEFSFSLDGHAGYVDAIYGFIYRQFDDSVATLRDNYSGRDSLGGVYNVISNNSSLEHNAVPESRYYAHRVQLHTSLTGSLVSALSYTYAKRENTGSLSDTSMLFRPEDTIHNAAFNLNFTPDQLLTFSVRYRFVEVEKTNPAQVVNPFFTNSNIAVRPSVEFYRNSLTASAIYRPLSSINIKAEYDGEFVNRSHTEYWLSLPDETDLHKGTLTITARPFKGLRMKALYRYATANNPAYGTSFGERHEGQFLVNYSSMKKWGGSLIYRITADKNDDITRNVIDSSERYNMPQKRKIVTTTANLWIAPSDRFTLSFGYGLLWGAIDQMILFQATTPNSQADASYLGKSQIYMVNGTYQITGQLAFSAGLQQQRASAVFEPTYKVVGTGDTSGVADISKVDTIENSLLSRIEYRFHKNFSCALDYSYSDYDSRTSSLYEGTVQKIMASVRTTW